MIGDHAGSHASSTTAGSDRSPSAPDAKDDGTAVDALCEGLHLLGNAELPVRMEPAELLPALYIASVAAEDESVAGRGTRPRRCFSLR